ncbi:hypothetical protein HPB49_017554 [Dermacentor silvarum]|uniref:Uncharacterized protein n=1 Tax=Dermacentor silvarum TaxID=543639 RepID=A0ACB8CYU3_DERSI|nr:hypothetical protein HPB49_017554 [Dermacentor silvarum]
MLKRSRGCVGPSPEMRRQQGADAGCAVFPPPVFGFSRKRCVNNAARRVYLCTSLSALLTSSGALRFQLGNARFEGARGEPLPPMSNGATPPTFLNEPPVQTIFANSTGALMSCSAAGQPRPSITWTNETGSPLEPLPGLRRARLDGTLEFFPFRGEEYRQDVHSTRYRCRASNALGTVISRSVHVRASPLDGCQKRSTGGYRLCIIGEPSSAQLAFFSASSPTLRFSPESLPVCTVPCARFSLSATAAQAVGTTSFHLQLDDIAKARQQRPRDLAICRARCLTGWGHGRRRICVV